MQDHAYWGCESTADECAAALREVGLPFETRTEQALWDRVTDLMIAGKVVGWFQGRMEFGARALGNRSLIADPRRTDMRDIINLRIKFREKFRPFAPSILEEEVGNWFEIDEPTPSHKPENRNEIEQKVTEGTEVKHVSQKEALLVFHLEQDPMILSNSLVLCFLHSLSVTPFSFLQ